jgi:hypothetical protein
MRSTILGLSICLTACLMAIASANPGNFLLTKSWMLVCKPCSASLVECENCIKDSCNECVSQIANSDCRQCGQKIVTASSNSFYCDRSVPMHVQACKINCRSRDVNPYNQDGTCDPNSGLCVCCKFFLFLF